jgi:hypothetical protein
VGGSSGATYFTIVKPVQVLYNVLQVPTVSAELGSAGVLNGSRFQIGASRESLIVMAHLSIFY